MKTKKLINIIVIPIFNDWKSLTKLLFEINKNANINNSCRVLVIDDFSSKKESIKKKKFRNIKKIEILRLENNIGSQKAIAVALNYLKEKRQEFDFITIMDGDGEDNPKEIIEMIETANKNRNSVVVSCRKNRQENYLIKSFYRIHLIITFFFTGKWISFGNFSCFYYKNLAKILSDNSVWYAYSAAVMKNTSIKRIYASREKRYFDKTKVNIFFLILHSLRIIGVFNKKLIFFSFLYLLILNFFSIKYLLFINFIITIFILVIFLVMKLSKKENSYKFKLKKIK